MFTMGKQLITLTFLSMFIHFNKSFNIEVRDPIVKKGDPGSYFGYSVAEHITKEGEKWLLVGAPLGNNLQPRTNHSGALYKCPMTENSPRDCTQVKTDGRRLASGQYKSQEFDYDDGNNRSDESADDLLPPGLDEIKDEQWMGVTVKSQKIGGLVMVCAHRYITSQNLSQTHNGLGLCYSLTSNLEYDYNWEPCKGRAMISEHQQFGYCQAGTSLAFLPDGTALIGSPGPYTWRGTMFVVKVEGDFLDRDKNVYLGPLNDKPEPIDKYSYLGMSVTAGKYFDKNITTYASGAPRAKHHGQVYFFNKQVNEVVMNISLIINGEQFASNYGYEMLSMDINNDGYDDLLVAAPFFYNKTTGGAVYIYYNLRNCKSSECTFDQKLVGSRESRFGFSMTSLGDINLDGYNDVAIGAPYEDTHGAIYVYFGGKDGLQPTPSQIIKYNSGPKTLGYSLSGGFDMDDNHYPDLLSGAYESDMVVLFRTRPIIHIDIEVKGKELKNIDTNKQGCEMNPKSKRTCFTFDICFKLKKPLNHRKAITVRSFIEADINKRKGKFSRVRFDTTSEEPSKELYIPVNYDDGGKEFSKCQKETVYIKENIRDILTPIKFNISYTLAENYTLSPLLNKTSVQEFMATFQKDCGADDICQSKLVLTGGLELSQNYNDNKYVLDLGSVKELNLNLNVTNLKESAYEAQLFVFHSISVHFIALRDKLSDIKCTSWNDTVIACYLGNPFQKEKSVSLGLRFESKNDKMNLIKELEFFAFVNSTSEELSKQTEIKLVAEVKKRAEVKITSASTSFAFYGGPVKRESLIQYFDQIGTRVWHTYQVSNEGPWAVDKLEVIILWPLQLVYPINSDKWLLYLEEMPMIEYDGRTVDDCVINYPYIVNKMNYTHRPGMDLPENFMLPPQNIQPEPYLLRQMQGQRTRRDVSRTSLDVLGCADGFKNCTIECSLEKETCAQITCSIPKLLKGNEATIKIKSRVSNSTLVEFFKKKDFITIISKAKIVIGDENIEQDIKDDTAKAETIAYHDNPSQDTSIPMWVIILAVLVGILVFLAIVFCLYKFGFFKRNRIKDETLSANIKKQDEGESLLNVN